MDLFLSNILSVFIILLAISYSFLIAYFSISWMSVKPWQRKKMVHKTTVSIIVPVRNESLNIIQCLEKIILQDYPSDLFEIIICDDSSSDNTVELVREFILLYSNQKIQVLELAGKNLTYKKQAITEAVKIATGELIVTTDGDCVMSKGWISEIVDYYEENQVVMIAGPVFFHSGKSIFSDMQSLEFMSLVGTGLGSVSGNFPVMCNGANLAYTKKAFNDVGGYSTNSNYASGDDIFLLLKINKLYPGKVSIIKSKDAIVLTNAQKNIRGFISQRLRWVSKSSGYRSFPAIFTSIVVFLMNFTLLFSGLLSFFRTDFFYLFLALFSVKMITDLPVLISITGFCRRRGLLLYFLPLQIIYIVYVSLIGIAGNIVRSTWKGRKIN